MSIETYDNTTGIYNVQPGDYDLIQNLFADYYAPGAFGTTKGLLNAVQKFFGLYLNNPRDIASGLNVNGDTGDIYRVRYSASDLEGYLGDKIKSDGDTGITLTVNGTSNKIINIALNLQESDSTSTISLLKDEKTLKKMVKTDSIDITSTEDELTFAINEAYKDTLTYGIKYVWDVEADMNAETGMSTNDLGVRKDLGEVWRYETDTWNVFFSLASSGGTTVTTNVTNIALESIGGTASKQSEINAENKIAIVDLQNAPQGNFPLQWVYEDFGGVDGKFNINNTGIKISKNMFSNEAKTTLVDASSILGDLTTGSRLVLTDEDGNKALFNCNTDFTDEGTFYQCDDYTESGVFLHNIDATYNFQLIGIGASGVTDHTLLTNIGTKTHDELETELNEHNANILTNEDNITNLTTKVTTNEGDITTLDTRVTYLEDNPGSGGTTSYFPFQMKYSDSNNPEFGDFNMFSDGSFNLSNRMFTSADDSEVENIDDILKNQADGDSLIISDTNGNKSIIVFTRALGGYISGTKWVSSEYTITGDITFVVGERYDFQFMKTASVVNSSGDLGISLTAESLSGDVDSQQEVNIELADAIRAINVDEIQTLRVLGFTVSGRDIPLKQTNYDIDVNGNNAEYKNQEQILWDTATSTLTNTSDTDFTGQFNISMNISHIKYNVNNYEHLTNDWIGGTLKIVDGNGSVINQSATRGFNTEFIEGSTDGNNTKAEQLRQHDFNFVYTIPAGGLLKPQFYCEFDDDTDFMLQNFSMSVVEIAQNITIIEAAGVTDHTLLTNIGTKTHAELDTEVNYNGITADTALSNSNANGSNITALDGRVTTNETDIATNTASASLNETNISALNGRVTVNETDIDTLDGRITTNETDINALETDVTNLDIKTTQTDLDVNALETAVASNDADITTLSGRITTNETDITNTKSRVTVNESEIDTLQADVISNSGEIDTLQADVISNSDEIDTLQADLGLVEGRVTVNETDIGLIEGRLIVNEADIDTLQSDVISNSDEIDTLQADLDLVEGRLIVNEADIYLNTTNITSNTASIDNLDIEVTALETAVATNVTEINAVDERVSNIEYGIKEEIFNELHSTFTNSYFGEMIKLQSGRILVGSFTPGNQNANMYFSDDEGLTWNGSIILNCDYEVILTITQLQSGRILISGDTGNVFYSDTDGTTGSWVKEEVGTNIGSITCVTQLKSGRILLGTGSTVDVNGDVIISDDDGDSWQNWSNLNEREIKTITQMPSGDVIIGTYFLDGSVKGKLMRSYDDGLTFTEYDIIEGEINAVYVIDYNNSVIMLSSGKTSVSYDDGFTFTNVNEVYFFDKIIELSTGRLVALSNNHYYASIFYSDNNGYNWTEVETPGYEDPNDANLFSFVEISDGRLLFNVTDQNDHTNTDFFTSNNINLKTQSTGNLPLINTVLETITGLDVIKFQSDANMEFVSNIKTNTLAISNIDVSGIAQNTSGIALNTTDIATNTLAISNIDVSGIALNTTDIATNVTDIATNVTDIGTNTTDISNIDTRVTTLEDESGGVTDHTLLTNIGTKTHDELEIDIAQNTSDIATNTTAISNIDVSGIAQNTSDIAQNTTAISNIDVSGIAQNTSDIATNTTDITQNTTDIATNTTDIATNTANIGKVGTKEVDETNIADGKITSYNSTSDKVEYIDAPTGGGTTSSKGYASIYRKASLGLIKEVEYTLPMNYGVLVPANCPIDSTKFSFNETDDTIDYLGTVPMLVSINWGTNGYFNTATGNGSSFTGRLYDGTTEIGYSYTRNDGYSSSSYQKAAGLCANRLYELQVGSKLKYTLKPTASNVQIQDLFLTIVEL